MFILAHLVRMSEIIITIYHECPRRIDISHVESGLTRDEAWKFSRVESSLSEQKSQ